VPLPPVVIEVEIPKAYRRIPLCSVSGAKAPTADSLEETLQLGCCMIDVLLDVASGVVAGPLVPRER